MSLINCPIIFPIEKHKLVIMINHPTRFIGIETYFAIKSGPTNNQLRAEWKSKFIGKITSRRDKVDFKRLFGAHGWMSYNFLSNE